jgi:hypothetical protein
MERRHRRYAWKVLRTGQRKHLLRWLRSRDGNYLLETPSPWITFDAIDRLSAYLAPGMKVFEYGSGGSTLFWLQWPLELWSVEHDPAWFDVVKSRIPAGSKVDYRLVPAEPFADENVGKDPSDPHAFVSLDEPSRGRTYRGYAGQIDPFPDASFDVVLVDGRARPSCMWQAAPKVKPGGLLVLDNADRDYYLPRLGERLGGFRRERYPGVGPHDPVMWETDVFVRS